MSSPARPAADLFADRRPVTALADLFAKVWQLAYVTNDLERGLALMRERHGFEHVIDAPLDGATFYAGQEPMDLEVRIAVMVRGGLTVEMIEPLRGDVAFYTDSLPADGSFAVRLHHVGTFVVGDEELAAVEDVLARNGMRFEHTLILPGVIHAAYTDTRTELGHWLEVCNLKESDIEHFRELAAQTATGS